MTMTRMNEQAMQNICSLNAVEGVKKTASVLHLNVTKRYRRRKSMSYKSECSR